MAGVGMVIFWVSGAIMFLFELYWFMQWWELGGVIAAVLIPPLAVVFPFVFLIKEGFSALYFGVWAAGLLGMFVGTLDD